MAALLKGAEAAAALKTKYMTEAEQLRRKGIMPALGIIRVGARQDDIYYENSIIRCGNRLGVEVKQYLLEEAVTQEKLISTIQEINKDNHIHGILMFRPLPKQLDENEACQAISPDKDVDGVTDSSMTGVYAGRKQGFPPCTPQACMEILNYYHIDCTGKKAVVVGRSQVVGKPAAMLLLERNATTTICHSKTNNLPDVCKEADILIAAAGKAEMITGEYLKPGQIIIDVGINTNKEGKLCGDVLFADAERIAEAVTPVPGGVGIVTTTLLIGHVIEAAMKENAR